MGFDFLNSVVAGSIVLPDTMTANQRGYVGSLGKLTGLNLNSVAQTTIFTTPAAGITRCFVFDVFLDNISGVPTTNAISFGASGTPTDWLASTVLSTSLASGKGADLSPAIGAPFAVYGTSIAFVANVTVGGAAITCDLRVIGFYE